MHNYCTFAVTCPGEVVHAADGVYEWPTTVYGEKAEVECPAYKGNYAYRLCVLLPNATAEWLQPDNAQCLVVSLNQVQLTIDMRNTSV